MRCTACDRTPVKLELTLKDRASVTLHSCACTRRWVQDGRTVELADVLAAMPKRRPRAARRLQVEAVAA